MSRPAQPTAAPEANHGPRFRGNSGFFPAGLPLALLGVTLLATGCVVTDPIEFKDEVDLPPVIIDDPSYPNGSIIRFERVEGRGEEIRINLKIRDENTAQVLKVRTLIRRAADTIVYTCPETVLASGAVLRDYPLSITQSSLNPGECHKVEVAVSGHFERCREDPDLAERLFEEVEETHANDIARATFWIWETSNNVLGVPAATQGLVNSCQSLEYEPTSATIP
jgi:hypothetical protein